MTTEVIRRRAFEDPQRSFRDGLVTGRLVPYDRPTWVRDVYPDGSLTPEYLEGFRRGAFDRLFTDPRASVGRIGKIPEIKQASAVGNIRLRDMHDRLEGIGVIGVAKSIEEREDGLWGTFKVFDGDTTNKVRGLLDAGTEGLSIEFRDVSHVEEGGVTWRTSVILDAVALVWNPAYGEAQVATYRSMHEAEDDEHEQGDDKPDDDGDDSAREGAGDAPAADDDLDAWLAELDDERSQLAELAEAPIYADLDL